MNTTLPLLYFSLLIVFFALFLSGCSQRDVYYDDDDGDTGGRQNRVVVENRTVIENNTVVERDTVIEVENAASSFCRDNGGSIRIKTERDGSQTGYCLLNGAECELVSLYRGECSKAHVCTTLDQNAEICTANYNPVCGSNEKTYANGCGACSDKVTFWTEGECGTICGDCPAIEPIGPNFCRGGVIVPGGMDDCGCEMPPVCEP